MQQYRGGGEKERDARAPHLKKVISRWALRNVKKMPKKDYKTNKTILIYKNKSYSFMLKNKIGSSLAKEKDICRFIFSLYNFCPRKRCL